MTELKRFTPYWIGKHSFSTDRFYYAGNVDAHIKQLEQTIAKLEKVIGWANNSLYGSHGFFLSTNGGEDNEHHLDSAIEKLKEQTREQYATIAAQRDRHAMFMEKYNAQREAMLEAADDIAVVSSLVQALENNQGRELADNIKRKLRKLAGSSKDE